MGDLPGEELHQQPQQLEQPVQMNQQSEDQEMQNLNQQADARMLQQEQSAVRQAPEVEVDVLAQEGDIRSQFLVFGTAVTKLDRALEEEGYDAALKTGKKDDASFVQLRRAVERVKTLYDAASREEKIDSGEALIAVMRLAETANGYYDLHRGSRMTGKGKSRKGSAVKLQELSNAFYLAMARDLNLEKRGEDEEPLKKDKAAYAESYRSTKKHTKRLALLADNYKKWAKHFAFQEGREREKIKDKLALFRPFEEDIKAYEEGHKQQGKEYNPEIKAVIDIWHEYKLRDRVLDHFEKKGNLKERMQDSLQDMITGQADQYGEKEKEKKLSAEKMDQNLSRSQLLMLDRIDRWFVRNYNNSGIVGSMFGVRNHHGEIISELFSKTKRERLFIYYLIETGKRKSPEVIDAFQSQNSYLPNVDNFKKQMLTSKLKIIPHLTGTYVYMNKLTEAMQINRAFKDELENAAELEQKSAEWKERKENLEGPLINDQKELSEKKEEKGADDKGAEALESVRQDAVIGFYTVGVEYRELMVKTAMEKDKKKKASLKEMLNKKAGEMEAARKRLIDADDAFGQEKKTDTAYKPNSNILDTNFYGSLYGTGVGAVGENAGMGADYAVKGAGAVRNLGAKVIGRGGHVSWGLSGTQLAKSNLYAGVYSTAGINAISKLVSVGAALYDLTKHAGNMHAGDIGLSVAEIVKNVASTGKDVFNTIQTGQHYAGQIAGKVDVEKAYEVSKNLKLAGVVLGATSVMIGTGKTISALLDVRNSKKAAAYFKRKNELINEPEKSEEEKRKKEKELRYEKNMLRLSDKMSKHKTKYTAIDTVISALAPAGLFVPGLGLVSIAAGIGSSIMNVSQLGDNKTDMIDQYLQFDTLYENALKKMKAENREIHDEKAFKEQLRRRLLAAAGFSDVASAADQIGKKYADFIRCKLFEPGSNLSADEREAYIQLVKSFGLPYDEKKGKPDAYMLARKISGR